MSIVLFHPHRHMYLGLEKLEAYSKSHKLSWNVNSRLEHKLRTFGSIGSERGHLIVSLGGHTLVPIQMIFFKYLFSIDLELRG